MRVYTLPSGIVINRADYYVSAVIRYKIIITVIFFCANWNVQSPKRTLSAASDTAVASRMIFYARRRRVGSVRGGVYVNNFVDKSTRVAHIIIIIIARQIEFPNSCRGTLIRGA